MYIHTKAYKFVGAGDFKGILPQILNDGTDSK